MSVDRATQVSGPGWKKGSSQGPDRLDQGGDEKRPRNILPDRRREGMDLVRKLGMGLAKPPTGMGALAAEILAAHNALDDGRKTAPV